MPDPFSIYSIDAILLYPFAKYISKKFCENIHPNVITIINFILGFSIIYYLYCCNLNLTINMKYLIVFLIILRVFLDALDGTIARMYKKESEFGRYLDISSDIFFYIGLIVIIFNISQIFSLSLLSVLILFYLDINTYIISLLHDNTLLIIPLISIIMFMIPITNFK